MDFRIQDPSWEYSSYLLEDILDACKNAEEGGAVFAFASPGGVRLLLRDPEFDRFLQNSRFDLVIGVDAVTNTVALDLLQETLALRPNLTVRVLFDSSTQALFHPKMCWFADRKEARWLVGSGNLTAGGLRGNIEAFTVVWASRDEHLELLRTWRDWLTWHNQHLRALEDQDVKDRAAQNVGRELPEGGPRSLRQELLVERPDGRISVRGPQLANEEVLIAEIPKGSDRWNQANFDKQSFEKFFGATPGKTQRILLTHVSLDGTVGDEELRPSVAVKSHNYRFELEAASGLPYPAAGRPIGVFIKLGTRTFRYHLAMPDQQGYVRIAEYLKLHVNVPDNRVRRMRTNARHLANAWPDCPLLRLAD